MTRLAVVDDRSRFATVSLGWRGDAERLRATISPTALDAALSSNWTSSAGACCLTATLQPEAAAPWTARVLDAARAIAGDAVLAVVGDERAVAETAGVAPRMPAIPPALPPALPSALQQERRDGYESSVVTGADPAAEVGAAAAFLAICRVAAGPDPLIPAALRAAGGRSIAQVSRGLQDGRPGLTWQVVSPAGEGISALEAVLSAAQDASVASARGAEAARAFARANLRRPWRAPESLARTLTEYEVMGWGGGIVLDPDAALAEVDGAALQRAAVALVRPIADVVGWG